jgi:beta-glucosidase
MPGTDGWRQTSKVIRSFESKKLTLEVVKERARTVVEFVKKVANAAPEVRGLDSAMICGGLTQRL